MPVLPALPPTPVPPAMVDFLLRLESSIASLGESFAGQGASIAALSRRFDDAG